MTTTLQAVSTFSQIVIATDFSEESNRAIEYAKAIARRFGSGLLVVHVADPINSPATPEGGVYYDWQATTRDEEMTEAAGEALRAEGFNARAVCLSGAVAEEIVREAEASNADLVVSGSRALLGASRWIHGSISEEVARKLHLPLLTVGPKAALIAGKQWRPERLLCAASIDQQSEAAIMYTDALAKQLGASWEIACDYCGEQGNSAAWDEFRVEVEQKIQDVRGHGRSIPAVFLSRPHAEYLAELATMRNADLIIMGHSHGLLKWSMLHSGTLPQLLAEAPCPVLTIPEKTA